MTVNIGTHRLYPEGTHAGPSTERRCNGCREWYPAKFERCVFCGLLAPAYNKWLRTALLNSNLNSQIN